MQRIRSLLAFGGEDAADETAWSGAFIQELERQHSGDRADHSVMRFFIAELKEHRQRHAQIIRELRRFLRASKHAETIRLLMTVPGIGFVSAATFVTEVIDVNRFSKVDHLYAMIGGSGGLNLSVLGQLEHGIDGGQAGGSAPGQNVFERG